MPRAARSPKTEATRRNGGDLQPGSLRFRRITRVDGRGIANRFDRELRLGLCRHSEARSEIRSETIRRAICAGDRWSGGRAGRGGGGGAAWISIDILSGTRASLECRWIVIKWTSMARTIHAARPTSDNTLSGSFEAYCSFVRATTPAIRTWRSSWKVSRLTRPWITGEDHAEGCSKPSRRERGAGITGDKLRRRETHIFTLLMPPLILNVSLNLVQLAKLRIANSAK